MGQADQTSCALTGTEMADRIAAWQEVASHALSREVEANRIISVYPKDPQLSSRLQDLITAEASCCGFLKFIVEERDDRTVVELSFPEEARALVENVIA